MNLFSFKLLRGRLNTLCKMVKMHSEIVKRQGEMVLIAKLSISVLGGGGGQKYLYPPTTTSCTNVLWFPKSNRLLNSILGVLRDTRYNSGLVAETTTF